MSAYLLTKFVGGSRDRQDVDPALIGRPEVIVPLPVRYSVDWGSDPAVIGPVEPIKTERYRRERLACGPRVSLTAFVTEAIKDPGDIASAISEVAFDLHLWVVAA